MAVHISVLFLGWIYHFVVSLQLGSAPFKRGIITNDPDLAHSGPKNPSFSSYGLELKRLKGFMNIFNLRSSLRCLYFSSKPTLVDLDV